MPYAALDLHKREIEAAVFDDSGQITHRQRFAGTAEAILRFAKRYLSPLHKVVMEATFNTWTVVELPVALDPVCAARAAYGAPVRETLRTRRRRAAGSPHGSRSSSVAAKSAPVTATSLAFSTLPRASMHGLSRRARHFSQ
jgi:hypothetical protein